MGLKDSAIRLLGGTPKPIMSDTIFYGASSRSSNKLIVTADSPATIKTTPETQRISPYLLEQDYLVEPVVFNSINKSVQLIMSAGYIFQGEEKSVAFFEEWFDRIGSRGGETDKQDLWHSTFKHQLMFGSAWNEIIPAKGYPDKPVDLDLIDPKLMDYAKDNQNRISLDENGNPVGYVQTLPYSYSVSRQKYDIPESVTIQSNQIFLPPKQIAHYKLYTTGDTFYPIGLIEPAHNSIVRKFEMEKAWVNWMKRFGFPTKKMKWGDMNHEPTNEVLQRAAEELAKSDEMGVYVYPYWADVSQDEVKSPDKLMEGLDYYIRQIVSPMGLPEVIASGKSDATNRSTLAITSSLMKLTLKDIVRRTVQVMEKKVIQPVALANKIEPVNIRWGEIAIEELDDKAKRLTAYVQAGLLTPDAKLQDLIRKIENLPEREISESTKANPETGY